jgi:hypothetical protein
MNGRGARTAARVFAALVAAATFAAAAAAQELRRLEVHVTSVAGRDVYLDMGRTSGLAPGLLVELYPPGVVVLEVEIRSVSANSARAELPPGSVPPPVGTRGEVAVPKARPAPPPARSGDAGRPVVPDHPPWTRTLDPRDPDQPLLVPTYGQRPEERPMLLDGRLFASVDWNRDHGGDRSSDYLLARAGVYANAENALGFGERTRFAGEVDDRRTQLPDQPDSDELHGRIDELSVAFGTAGSSPLGVQVGRFPSLALPEIGLVDGVEAVLRCEGGICVGGGAGAYPLPFPDRASGDDLGVHAFLDYTSDERRSFAATAGVQKTWHLGAPDRDLLLLRVEGRPRDEVSLYASAKVDWYTSGDTRKSAGPAVTEFLGQARWDGSQAGVGLSYSHFEYPDLLRAEYQNLPDELVRDGHVERVSLSGWLRPAPDVHLHGRADSWRDQDDHGTAFEVGADWTDIAHSSTDVSAQLFLTDGGFQAGPGARLAMRHHTGEVDLVAAYRWYGYEVDSLLSGNESYVRQSLEAGASWSKGDFDLDFRLEHWFGTKEDAYAIAFYVQWRF